MNKWFNKALFAENLKRFWSIPAVSLFLFYIFGINTIIRDRDNVPHYYIRSLLSNQYFWIVLIFGIPLVSAFVVFSYMLNKRSTNVVHAMPVSRKSLFVTNYISGLVLSVLPIIITAAALFVLRLGVSTVNTYAQYEIFTAGNILGWIGVSLVFIFYTFALSVFGVIVSGNMVIGLLTAGTANIILPILSLCLLQYQSDSYFGYYDNFKAFVFKTSPVFVLTNVKTELAGSGANVVDKIVFDWTALLLYTLFAVVVLFASYLLYNRRANENVGESYVFSFMEKIIGFIFVFVPCTIFGMAAYNFWGNMSYVYGGIIGFVLGQMITRKTFHIADKKGFKNLIVFTACLVLIVVAFKVDLFGYERKIPDINDIKSAKIYSSVFELDEDRNIEGSDEETIAAILNFHENIVENRKTLKKEDSNKQVIRSYYFTITYTYKNGIELKREYCLNQDYLSGSNEFYTLMDIYNKETDFSGFFTLNPEDIRLLDSQFSPCYVKDLNTEEKAELLECIRKDLAFIDYSENVFETYVDGLRLEITMRNYTEAKAYAFASKFPGFFSMTDMKGGVYVLVIDIPLYDNYENTLEFLKTVEIPYL